MLKQTISLQIFQRLSSTNFTWTILEYLDPNQYGPRTDPWETQYSMLRRYVWVNKFYNCRWNARPEKLRKLKFYLF